MIIYISVVYTTSTVSLHYNNENIVLSQIAYIWCCALVIQSRINKNCAGLIIDGYTVIACIKHTHVVNTHEFLLQGLCYSVTVHMFLTGGVFFNMYLPNM